MDYARALEFRQLSSACGQNLVGYIWKAIFSILVEKKQIATRDDWKDTMA